MRTKSNFLKLMDTPCEERKITTFPLAFHQEGSPYQQTDYSSNTRMICSKEKEVVSGFFKICKTIVLGDVCVGKTCIVNRFCNRIFESNYKSTIGVDFEVERFDILDIPFNVQIWDTAGQERFKCIAQSYYRASKIVIIVFDLSCISSLANSKSWYKDVIHVCSEDPLVFLVGTKKDLLSPAAYSNVEKAALKVAKQLKAEFWAVSAKTGENINEFFNRAAALAFDDLLTKDSEKYSLNVEIGSEMISFKPNLKKERRINICTETQCIIS